MAVKTPAASTTTSTPAGPTPRPMKTASATWRRTPRMLAPALAAARGALRGTSLPGDEHAEQAADGEDASRSARPVRGRARSWAALIARPQRGFGGRVQDRIVRSMPAQLTRRAKQRGFAATSRASRGRGGGD